MGVVIVYSTYDICISHRFERLNSLQKKVCMSCYLSFPYGVFNDVNSLYYGPIMSLDLELRKKLVKCYIWSIALYGAET
jgi:hypothetical protein